MIPLETPADVKGSAGLPPAPCSAFWGCVAASVESVAKALADLRGQDGYSRGELNARLAGLVAIMERAAVSSTKIDGQNADGPTPETQNPNETSQ